MKTKEAMGNKPVIAVINLDNPMVFTEVDAVSDAILVRFASSDNAVLDIISGKVEPSGLLPLQMPKDMAAVEEQYEDVPRDMECYVDSDGNTYDFAFGLNWSGVINDERVKKYKVDPLTSPESGSTTDDYVTVLTHTLHIGKIGTPYSAKIETKEAGATLTLVDGVLPEGLSFNNGTISGTPAAGTHRFGNQLTIKASAEGKQDRIFRITLVVNETGPVNLADPNELSILLTLAKAKVESNYTSDTWAAFAEALEAAQAVYDNASASTQDEIDNAANALKNAMAALKRIGDEGPVLEKVATPTASVASGTYDEAINVTLSCATPGATIYYTTDGTTPTTQSARYNRSIIIRYNTTLKAIAVKADMENSDVAVYNYIIRVATPTATPGSNSYPSLPDGVILSCSTPDASIYYTTGPNAEATPDPSASTGTLYTGPIQVTESMTIKAVAVKSGAPDSYIAVFTYTIDPNIVQLTDEASIDAVMDQMTLEEKVSLLGGVSSGNRVAGAAGGTQPNLYYKYGIPGTSLADGPAGVRINALPPGLTDSQGNQLTRYATQFPNAAARAATWNVELGHEIGEAVGKELYYFGSDLWLAPGMNIHRHPLNGRNFEYYSEDPLLSGKFAAAEVNGLQSEGVGATIKHFAANNQETGRSNLITNIGQRALREIYLKGFEIAVKEAQPWAIMTAYNQINGYSCAQNPELTTTIVRDEWGFNGIIMTDWGGQGNSSYWGSDSPNAHSSLVKAGVDLSMPSGNPNNIIAGYNAGFLTMDEIDAAVRRFLQYIVKTPRFKGVPMSSDPNIYAEENEEVAYKTAVESMIILKNEEVNGKPALPLNGETILTIGNATNNMVRGGAGSGNVNIDTSRLVHLAQALKDEGKTVIDATTFDFPQVDSIVAVGGMGGDPAFKEMQPTREQLLDLVDSADSVIMTIRRGSAENIDVKKEKGAYYISDAERYLIETASEFCREQGKPFVVVLNMGGPIEIESWKDKADAILLAWEPGTVLAKPVAAVLVGKENPSGKLPTTFPIDVEGTAENSMPYVATGNEFGKTSAQGGVTYNEGIYVGYRYYDTFNVPVSYEFGYGKSYSTFEYSNLNLSSDTFNDTLNVTVDITNTSSVPGKEVVQLYVGAPGVSMHKPVKELKAFAKTKVLEGGETETLSFTLDAMSLASYDEDRDAWVAEPGVYTVYAAASSKDIRLTATFTVPNEIVVETAHDVLVPKVEINELRPETIEEVYKNPNAPVEDRVADLLSRMTLEEKVGQMLQPEVTYVTPEQVKNLYIGSVLSGGGADPKTGNEMQDWYDMVKPYVEASLQTRLGIPIIYGVDAVHGHSNIIGATIFPHNIGLGAIATGNLEEGVDIVKRIGAVTAEEMRVTGIRWNFAPCLANPQDISWGRTYEGFSEDLDIVAELGVAYVQGLQGDTIDELKNPNKAVATVKHYIGEGYTENGTNQGNVTSMTKEEVAEKLLKPYADTIAAGVRAVMPSFHSIQGVKMHASKYLLTDVLKEQLGFDGFVITDYNAIQQINVDEDGNPVSGLKNQLKVAINAGCDMLMQVSNYETCINHIKQLVADEQNNPGSGIPMSRIDDAVARILRVKFQAGLFDNPIDPNPAENPEIAEEIGSDEHRALAREAVRKSLVLLKNDEVNGSPILSQLKDMDKIFVAGKSADDIGIQCGGWTVQWQGAAGDITKGTTILEGIINAAGEEKVTYSADGTGAEGYDVAIVVVSEPPYAEGNGDDLNKLQLSSTDKATLANVKEAGIPIVMVLISGRPMVITEYLDDIDGLVAAWLPGTEGDGVADVLFGDQDFVGRLPMKWPYYFEAIPLVHEEEKYVLFDTGYGLTKNQATPELPDIPTHPHDTIPEKAEPVSIPGNIEAEIYTWNSGFRVATDTASGTTFINSFDEGDYIKYYIDVPEDGTYTVEFRYSATRDLNNAISIKDQNGNVLGTITLTKNSNLGQKVNWSTVTRDIELRAGSQLLTISLNALGTPAQGESWRGGPGKLDWIKIYEAVEPAVEKPTASPAPGTYGSEQTVELSCATEGAEIYYTTDGNDPATTVSESVYKYSAPIIINVSTTIKAIAVKEGVENSEIAVFKYTIKAATPTASVQPGAVQSGTQIELSCATEGAKIYYTLDGSEPDTTSKQYDGNPITINEDITIKAIAVKDGIESSEIATFVYTIQP
ncbi:glycoside hydrolase family 3 N-terminal domain-containing protein [Thermoanaerobacterium sp. DL9XJH110]|uniref:glycoside hydrolase family 3 N-terminal domain-containing protein n=1 Tax=Thermoanaerobacterium sp. DL9XJH110 TaxID=3386643 RepID=UPI003BB60812